MVADVPLELRHHSNIAPASDFRCSDELAFTQRVSFRNSGTETPFHPHLGRAHSRLWNALRICETADRGNMGPMNFRRDDRP
jgi:hypothetical protein